MTLIETIAKYDYEFIGRPMSDDPEYITAYGNFYAQGEIESALCEEL